MPDFTEVAPRVWVAHYDWMHVNITLIGGSDGLVMVDTHGSAAQARIVADDVRRLGAGPLTGAGQHPRALGPLLRQRRLPRASSATCRSTPPEFALDQMVEARRPTPSSVRQLADHPRRRRDPRHHPAAGDRTASPPPSQLDLGDRAVELIHPGRGHTAGDLVVRVPDADVMVGGDLVEESDQPFIGDDSCPLEWPLTLDLVLGLMTAATVVVPGHGQVIDKDYVQDQRVELGIIAETIRDLACRGVPGSAGARARATGPGTRRCWRPPYGLATSTCRAARSACRSSSPLWGC